MGEGYGGGVDVDSVGYEGVEGSEGFGFGGGMLRLRLPLLWLQFLLQEHFDVRREKTDQSRIAMMEGIHGVVQMSQ